MPKPTKTKISALVKRFKKDRKKVWAAEKRKYEASKTLPEAIDAALGLRANDKIQDHQRRIGRRVLLGARTRLQKAKRRIKHARNFCELIRVVELATADLKRFGALAVYDVAMRIGIWKKIWPKYIYLHAGTREGARALGLSGDRLSKAAFIGMLDGLKPYQIEDFLCINKGFLEGHCSYKSACAEIMRSCREYLGGKVC